MHATTESEAGALHYRTTYVVRRLYLAISRSDGQIRSRLRCTCESPSTNCRDFRFRSVNALLVQPGLWLLRCPKLLEKRDEPGLAANPTNQSSGFPNSIEPPMIRLGRRCKELGRMLPQGHGHNWPAIPQASPEPVSAANRIVYVE